MHRIENKAPFRIKIILKYPENISISKNVEVLNTSRCLDSINIVDLKLKYSPKLCFFKYWRKRSGPLFFLKPGKKKSGIC
jgi:hypothetical protein